MRQSIPLDVSRPIYRPTILSVHGVSWSDSVSKYVIVGSERGLKDVVVNGFHRKIRLIFATGNIARLAFLEYIALYTAKSSASDS